MPRRNIRGQGFSLFGMQADISKVVEILSDALHNQGVDFNPDSLLLQIQNSIQFVAGRSTATVPENTYNYLQASDTPPYSMAGDLLAMGYGHFKIGDKDNKKKAIAKILEAMECEDFSDITAALLVMNGKSLEASEEEMDNEDIDETEDEDEDEDDEDEEEIEEEEEDLSEDDIDDLIDTSVKANEDEEEPNKYEEEAEDKELDRLNTNNKSNTDKTKKPSDHGKPMGDEDKSEVTASTSPFKRAAANKLSMSGDRAGLAASNEFLKKSKNKAA